MSPSAAPGVASRSILIIHNRLPAHDEDSGSRRLRWIVELLVRQGHRVTFLGHAGWNQARYATQLRDLGVEVHAFNGEWWRTTGRSPQVPSPGLDLESFLRRGRFDLAWISTYEMGEFYLQELRRLSPATRIALDTVDVHHVRELRGAELSGKPEDHARAQRVLEAERAIYTASDRLVAVSAPDAEALRAIAPDVPVSIVSNIHDIPEPGPGFADRHGLVFVGSFSHVPNVGAITGFVEEVWPGVRAAIPGATLTIVGPKPPASVQALAGDGITVTGWVPETRPYLDAARISIAPLRFGAGVKGKIGEAMSLGLPVVTTTVGAEGMDLIDGEHALVVDDPDAMAAAIARLHGDPELWGALSAAGPVHVDATLGTGAALAALDAVVEETLPTPFVVTDAWSDPATLPAVLRSYLAAHRPEDRVSLVLPTAGDADAAVARVLEQLDALGADPVAIPDVAILPAADRAPVPSRGVRVGAADWPEQDEVVTIAPDAPADAWVAAAAAPVGAPDPGRPLVSIVICLYGKREYTERCLASLERALGPRLGREAELVLVDNASPDDTREMLAQWEDRARVVLLDENRNFAGGNNAGAAVATGRVLLFLNNDTEVPAGVVEELAAEALRPSVGLAGLRLRYPDGRLQHGGFGWRGSTNGFLPFHLFHGEDGELPSASVAFDTSAVTGACIAIRAELFHWLGRFDEDFVNGWEDTDLSQRVRAAAARVRYRGDLEVLHHEGVTSGHHYASAQNEERFRARWTLSLMPDDEPLVNQLGLELGVFAGGDPRGRVADDGAPVVVAGPLLGAGPVAEEARGLLRALAAAGADVAARTPAPSWARPPFGDAVRQLLLDAHARDIQPDATTIAVPDGGFATPRAPIGGGPADPAVVAAAERPAIVRLADVPDAVTEGAVAWAATPALAGALVEAGWPAGHVFFVPPLGFDTPRRDGGGGVLALLADHDPAVLAGVLDGLALHAADLDGDLDAVVVPTARTSELHARVRARVPAARLTPPFADEETFGQLAAGADVVVALDPADRFDRRALRAASAGVAVVARTGGVAHALLGDLVETADPSDPQAVAAALARADRSAEARQARAKAVAAICDPQVALAVLGAPTGDAAARHAAGVEAFGRGDARTARQELERALAVGYDVEIANDLAVVCHAMGATARAEALLRECLARVPGHAGATENLALLSSAAAA